MSDWYCLHLGDGILAAVPLANIEEQFRLAYARAGLPEDMALFVRQQSEGGLHCDVSLYFSPAAAAVARAAGAEPCGRPLRQGLGLVIGHDACWSLLF